MYIVISIRMKSNIFKHIQNEHSGLPLQYEDQIKKIDETIAVKDDDGTGNVYVGAYADDGGIWELDKANQYR